MIIFAIRLPTIVGRSKVPSLRFPSTSAPEFDLCKWYRQASKMNHEKKKNNVHRWFGIPEQVVRWELDLMDALGSYFRW